MRWLVKVSHPPPARPARPPRRPNAVVTPGTCTCSTRQAPSDPDSIDKPPRRAHARPFPCALLSFWNNIVLPVSLGHLARYPSLLSLGPVSLSKLLLFFEHTHTRTHIHTRNSATMAAPADKTTKNLSGKWVLVRCAHEHLLCGYCDNLRSPVPSPPRRALPLRRKRMATHTP